MLRTTGTAVLLAYLVAAVGCGGGPNSRLTPPGGGNPPNDSTSNSSDTISISPASDTLRIGGKRQFSGFDRTVNQNMTSLGACRREQPAEISPLKGYIPPPAALAAFT